MKPVNVGICGLGTVGGGTFNVLTENAQDIARRAGREIVIAQVGALWWIGIGRKTYVGRWAYRSMHA